MPAEPLKVGLVNFCLFGLFCQQATFLHICFPVTNSAFTEAYTAAPSIDCMLREALPSRFVAPHHRLQSSNRRGTTWQMKSSAFENGKTPTTEYPLWWALILAVSQSKAFPLVDIDVRSGKLIPRSDRNTHGRKREHLPTNQELAI